MISAAWLSHERVVLGASFSDARFGSIGAGRQDVFGEDLQNVLEEAGLYPWPIIGCIEGVGPLAQRVDGAFETEAMERDMIEGGGSLHEGADQVVGDGMHGDFLSYHRGRKAAEHIHAHGGLDVAEEQLDGPSAHVQLGQIVCAVAERIGQGRNEDKRLGAEPRDRDMDMQEAQGKRAGRPSPFGARASRRALLGLVPEDESILRPEAFAVAPVAAASLMLADHGVDLHALKRGDIAVRAEGAIGEDDIAGTEEGEEPAEELAFMNAQGSFGPVQQGAGGQRETTDDLGNREAATGLLIGRLRENTLIGRCIGHGHAGPIDDFDRASTPALIVRDVSFQGVGGVRVNRT